MKVDWSEWVSDVVFHMFQAHVGAHVVLDVQDGVHDVPSEQAAGVQAIELWVMEAMIYAEVASGLDAAFKAIDAVDGSSFFINLLGDFSVGTEVRGEQVGWTAGVGVAIVGAVAWGGRQVHVVPVI